jgi:hypothetical protein
MTAPAIVATAGDPSANSYLSIAEADIIADGMIGDQAWSTATSDTKSRALITATNGMETLKYVGTRTNTTQVLSWPRTNASCGDWTIAADTVPSQVKLATFNLANALLTSPELLRTNPTTSALIPGVPNYDLRRLKLDVMEVEWRNDKRPIGARAVTPLSVLPHLKSILGCLTTSTIAGGYSTAIPLARS